MEPGDYVMKMLGAKDRGKKGLVISIVQGGPGNILVDTNPLYTLKIFCTFQKKT